MVTIESLGHVVTDQNAEFYAVLGLSILQTLNDAPSLVWSFGNPTVSRDSTFESLDSFDKIIGWRASKVIHSFG
jgi:hypothetical protein